MTELDNPTLNSQRRCVRNRSNCAFDFPLDEMRENYFLDVSCRESVPQTVDTLPESDGLEDAARKAVSIGGDSSAVGTTAAPIAQERHRAPIT